MTVNSSYSLGNFQYAYALDKQPPESLDNRHCHDTYEILYVIDGVGKLLVEGTVFDIKPGTIVVIRPFEYHSISMDKGHAYERYVLNFSEDFMVEDASDLLKKIIEGNEGSGRLYPAGALSESVLSLFPRFESAEPLPKNERVLYTKMILSELIVFLFAADGEYMTHTESELGARVIRYLNENITRDMSLDKIAKRFFVSKYYLCRAFKKHNGISVHGYINYKRVMYAKQLIESGETASGAAYKVGFGDYSAFYRAYVKVLGKAPTA